MRSCLLVMTSVLLLACLLVVVHIVRESFLQAKYDDYVRGVVGANIGSPYVKIDNKVFEANVVITVNVASPAARAGLSAWDLIVCTSENPPDLQKALRFQRLTAILAGLYQTRNGQPVFLTVLRPVDDGMYSSTSATVVKLGKLGDSRHVAGSSP